MIKLSATLASLALLAASAQAAPAPAPAPAPAVTPNGMSAAVIFQATAASINDCGDSSFENQTSGASPTVADCLKIAENIAGGGTWTTWGNPQRQLVQYGSCAFGVQTNEGTWYKVGNQDIIDLIHSSIEKFQWNGLVGAKGSMNCQSLDDSWVGVEWGLY